MSDFAVLFDMDGVIVDSNPYHKMSLKEFCSKYGYELTEEQLRAKIYGRANKEWIRNLFGEITQEQLEKYAQEKESLFRKLYEPHIQPVPGVVDFIQALAAEGIPQAVGTSAPPENFTFVMGHTQLGDYFPIAMTEKDVDKTKPHPEIYQNLAKKLGFEPPQCVVFEDSLSGVQAGLSAQCKVVGVATTHSPEELAHADLVIKDFVDFSPNHLKEIFST